MARIRMKLTVSAAAAAQLKQQIRAATDPRDKERLQVVLWATGGQHSLAQLAQLAGPRPFHHSNLAGGLHGRRRGAALGADRTRGQGQSCGQCQGASRVASRTPSGAVAYGRASRRLAPGPARNQTGGQVHVLLVGKSGRRAPGSASLPRQTGSGRPGGVPRRAGAKPRKT